MAHENYYQSSNAEREMKAMLTFAVPFADRMVAWSPLGVKAIRTGSFNLPFTISVNLQTTNEEAKAPKSDIRLCQ